MSDWSGAKFFVICLCSLLSFSFADEQIELGHLFEEDIEEWYEISFRCSELIPYFYEINEQDSLSYILQYWEEETGFMEPVRRAWILNQIARNSFEPDYLNHATVDDILDYMNRYETQKSDTSHWIVPGYEKAEKKPYYISADFNRFTRSLALELLQYSDLSDDEYLICLFYSHQFDEFWRLFETGEAKQTTLYKQVQSYRKTFQKNDFHYGFFLGYWSPRRSLALLGNKVNVGGLIGLEWQRLICDVSLLFQFLNSENPYAVKYEDELFETTHYFRFCFAVEPAFQLYDWGHTRVNLLGGIALDVLEVVPEEENPYSDEPIAVIGPNMNLGIGIQHYLKRGYPYYIQYQLRYEFVGYDTHGGTDLSEGEALSFRIGFFWDANRRKHELKKYF